MKLANPVLILILALVILGALTVEFVLSGSPKNEARGFADALQSGNLARAIGHFDVNTCHCVAPGGWGSYLVYQSNQEDNLAFLVGHEFQFGESRIVPINKKTKGWAPWFSPPEEAIVNVTFHFAPTQYSPVFLPLPLAYGMNMTLDEFEKFVHYPGDFMGRGFTLRLRSGLKPGSIQPNLENLDPKMKSRFSFPDARAAINLGQGSANSKTTVDSAKADALLQASLLQRPLKYVVPQESGKVFAKDGSVVPIENLEKQLPKLRSITLSLNLSHGGPLHNWAVRHMSVIEPTFTAGDSDKLIDLARSQATKHHYEP